MSEPQQTAANANQSAEINDAGLRHHAQELGLLGWLFGSREHAPGNIAGLAILAAFVCIVVVVFFLTDTANFTRKDAVLVLVSIITLALGFLFGRGSAGA